MRFAYTEDQLAIRDAVAALLADHCTPTELRRTWPPPIGEGTGRVAGAWERLAEMGVFGLLAPESAGGLGYSEIEAVAVLEETGRVGLPDPVLSTAMVAVPALVAASALHNDSPATNWLSRAIAGDAVITVGFDGATTVAGVDSADGLLLQTGSELHIVPRADVDAVPVESVDGARRLYRVRWTPTEDTLLASGAAGFGLVNAAFDRAALGAAAQLCGLADTMVQLTVGYASERRQFGVPIGSFQAVKHQLADAAMRVAFARPLVLRAAASIATADPDAPLHVSMAKAAASDAATFAGERALQCHGAIAYTVEYDLHLYLKRAWALASRFGDARFHRRRIAPRLLAR